MRVEDATRLLMKISAADQRTVGQADILFWAEVIPDTVETEDALNAVTLHYRKSTDRIMPAHVIRQSRRARATRLGADRYYGDDL